MQRTSTKLVALPIAGNTDTSFLKVLALCFMLVDHIGVVLFPGIPELRVIGRMAFPLYAWCLVVGSEKTRSTFRYALRLLAMALLSQPLYMMALNHTWTDYNIMFSLLIGLIAIYGIQRRWCFSQVWLPALCFLLLGYIHVDYGWRGLAFILVLFAARNTRSGLIGAYLAYALFWGTASNPITTLFGWELSFLAWPGIGLVLAALFRLQGMVWLSLPLVAIPTHTGIKLPQWLGYALYPLHLLLLILLRMLVMGAPLSTLLRGF